ncbi:YheC/YheD family protein [Mycoplasmatota bacterium zrk1]
MLIGVMHSRRDPNTVSKIYTLAAVAKLEGVDLFYFSPSQIDFTKKKIYGYYYEEEWKQKEFPYPDIVINTSRMKTEKQKKNKLRLGKEVPFTESKIHNKEYINNLLQKHPVFKNYLPDSLVVKTIKQVIKFVDKHSKAVLKPSVGSKGKRVIFIIKEGNQYSIYQDGKEEIVRNLKHTLSRLDLTEYILQQFIVSETKAGLPADFRVHTQKDSSGKYVIVSVYPRISEKKYRVSNISQGGYSAHINYYLKNQFNDNWRVIYNKLKFLGLQISEYLDEHYNNKLNQLGVDICIDEDNKLNIIEVNWRPGLHVLFSSNVNHIKNLIKYCIYRVNKSNDLL